VRMACAIPLPGCLPKLKNGLAPGGGDCLVWPAVSSYTASMQPNASTPAADAASSSPPAPQREAVETPATEPSSSRNFLVLAAYQVAIRTGWIFKTESVIMPAVLDYIAGSGWIRGCLPLLNRFGHSVPPLLMARRVKNAPRKKWVFFLTTAMMSAVMLGMAALFVNARRPAAWWATAVFLLLYAFFFVCIGVNHLAFNTLQGKLVETSLRGRLLLLPSVVGATTAVLCAFFLLPLWLEDQSPRYDLLFGMAGGMFALAALLSVMLDEPRDDYNQAATSVSRVFADAATLLRHDPQLRRLAFVGATFGSSIMLFPHYQYLGLREMRLELSNLMWWAVIQNIGTGLFSVPAGLIADRHGNRLVLQVTLLGIAAAPIIAMLLRHADAGGWFCLVFPLLGLTPVVIRTLQNFALELSGPHDHPRYLSTLGLCISLPLFFSLAAGKLIDLIGFEIVFVGICLVVLAGWTTTLWLREPRQHVHVGFLQTSD